MAAAVSCRGMGLRLGEIADWLVGLQKPTGEILEDIDKRYKGYRCSNCGV